MIIITGSVAIGNYLNVSPKYSLNNRKYLKINNVNTYIHTYKAIDSR